MPSFAYKAKDSSGASVEGVIEADARASVVARLQQMGYYPISIEQGGPRQAPKATNGASTKAAPAPAAQAPAAARPAAGGGLRIRGGRIRKGSAPAKPAAKAPAAKAAPAKAAAKAAAPAAKQGGMARRRRGIRAADIAAFNRQMSDLLTAGVALVKALTILQKQTMNEELYQVIYDVNSEVQGGATFADALARHPKVFSKLYVAMVRSGEAGGMLPEVLERLADFSETEEQLKGRVKSALAYPVVMVVAGGAAVFIMFSYVVPKIVSTFEELNQTLPAITQVLISISKFTEAYWPFLIGGVAALVAAIWQFLRTEDGAAIWHRRQLVLPIFGDLVRKREVARFSRTLGSLLKNGVPILTALNITKEVANNTVVKTEIDHVKDEITQGAGLAAPLRNSAIFPPVTVNMMAVGEETGQLERVLLRISDSFEIEVERKVRTLTALLEPLIICLMGLVVAFIVIAMLLPIFSLDPTGGTM